MPLPTVVFAPAPGCGGYFIRPRSGFYLVEDNQLYPVEYGLIVVSTLEDDENFGSIIAHEWRHIWQYWHGWEYDGLDWVDSGDYDASIVRYFKSSVSEADALKFEVRYEHSHYHDNWLALLTGASPWY